MALDYNSAQASSLRFKYSGKGYLDAKMQPVATLSDLYTIPKSHRFIGLSVVVLDDGNGTPQEYWLKEGVLDKHWVKKGCAANLDIVTGDDIYT